MELLLDVHLITDRGLARERNEDRCGAFTPEDAATRAERGRLFVVADGMGGYAGGDVAAELAVTTLPEMYFHGEWAGPESMLRRAFSAANDAITRQATAQPAHQGMGAAAVAAVVLDGHALFAHLGDCRAYRLRDGRAERMTADHSWVEERVAAGRITIEEARIHPYRNVLTRALGVEVDGDPTLRDADFLPGDALLLCSDGLWGVVGDDELAAAVVDLPDAKSIARTLVDLALDRGGPDNISIAVVRALEDDGLDGDPLAATVIAPTTEVRRPEP